MNTSKPPNSRQHFVPQFYLREWSSARELVWVYPTDGSGRFETGTSAVACQRGLYRHPSSDGVDPNRTDEFMTTIEGGYAAVWPDIFDRALHPATRRNMARFVALMAARHPRARESIREMHSKLREIAKAMEPDEKVQLFGSSASASCTAAEILLGTKDDPENVTSAFLITMPRVIERLSDVLCKRRWGIVFSEEPAFVTSDYPVVLNRGTAKKATYGFGTAGTEISFPICPTRMLVICDEWEHEFAHYRLTKADVFNLRVVQAADRFVFAYERIPGLENKIMEWRGH